MRDCMKNKCSKQRSAYIEQYQKWFGKPIASCWTESDEVCESLYAEKIDAEIQKALLIQIRATNSNYNLDDIQVAVLLRAYLKLVETLHGPKKSDGSKKDDYEEDDSDEFKNDDHDPDDDENVAYAFNVGQYGPSGPVDPNRVNGLEEKVEEGTKDANKNNKISSQGRLSLRYLSDQMILEIIKQLVIRSCHYSRCEYMRIQLMRSMRQRSEYLDCGAKECRQQHEKVMKRFNTYDIIMEALHLDPIKRLRDHHRHRNKDQSQPASSTKKTADTKKENGIKDQDSKKSTTKQKNWLFYEEAGQFTA